MLGALAVNPDVERAPTHVWVPETTMPLQIVSHISSFLFAYMGHSMYFEVTMTLTLTLTLTLTPTLPHHHPHPHPYPKQAPRRRHPSRERRRSRG